MTASLIGILSLDRKSSSHGAGEHECFLLHDAGKWEHGHYHYHGPNLAGAVCAPPSLIPSRSFQKKVKGD